MTYRLNQPPGDPEELEMFPETAHETVPDTSVAPNTSDASGLGPKVRTIRTLIQALAAFVVGLVSVIVAVQAAGIDVPASYAVWLTGLGAGLTALASVVQNTWDTYRGKP